MNAIERTLAVLAHRRPDRRPVDLHNFQPAAAMLGLPLREVFKNSDLIAHHICGNTAPILDDFIATGAQITEIDHKPDLAKARDAAQGKTTILGSIDTNLLAFGTPDEVDAACREAIEVMRVGKDFHTNFILGPGCVLDAKTPAENIHALVEAAKKHGRN
ncbi:MAG: uroporphyrinogen decarboxylase family protein [Anaerolineae bacterium]